MFTYPRRERGGSVDLKLCLSIDSMKAIENDQEVMDIGSLLQKISILI